MEHLEQMKTEVKAQPVSKMREALRYTLPGNSLEGVRKVPQVIPAADVYKRQGLKRYLPVFVLRLRQRFLTVCCCILR